MNKKEKIIQYLLENGVDIEKYIDWIDYQRPGTVVINSGRMFGYGGNALAWRRLLEIVESPESSVRMNRIRNRGPETCCSFRYLIKRDRLTWEPGNKVK